MKSDLERAIRDTRLNDAGNEALRFSFAYACASRVKHLLEAPAVVDCLDVLERHVCGSVSRETLATTAIQAERLAAEHQGSKSIDGCGHAAVSASYAVAKALSGKAVLAAEYSAYAMVYAQGGHAAVSDQSSFVAEWMWQARQLAALTSQAQVARESGQTV